MAKTILSNFRGHVASQLYESLTELANNVYYITASRHTEYDSGDDDIPTLYDSIKETEIDYFNELIFGKKISSNDIALMVNKYTWTSNTVYDKYSHLDNSLFNKQFYVVHKNGAVYNVYKCLNNNFESPSTQAPTDTDAEAEYFQTADGYVWKFLYQVSETTFEKFATANYMPVYTNNAVTGNTVDHAILTVDITSNGSSYYSTVNGTFTSTDIRTSNSTTYRLTSSASSNSDFYTGCILYLNGGTGAGQIRRIIDYTTSRIALIDSPFDTSPDDTTSYFVRPEVLITGDGEGALAYAEVNAASITPVYPVTGVVMVNTGIGYTYATATVVGNTGTSNAASNAAVLIPIITPAGGHGSDVPKELGCSKLGISVQYQTDETGYISINNDYRKISILKDPYFDNVTLTLSGEQGTTSGSENIYQFKYSTLLGTLNVSSASNSYSNSSGSVFDIGNSVRVGDNIYFYDTTNSVQCIRTVTAVNTTHIQVNSNVSFSCTATKFALATVTARGVRAGYSGGDLYLTNTEPKFVENLLVIGADSGAIGNVTNITVGESTKDFNSWQTFDGRNRIYISNIAGTFNEDEELTQSSTGSSGVIHEANSSVIYYTGETGYITSGTLNTVRGSDSQATANVTTKYTPDIVRNSGKLLYIESSDPISRSISQSETIRLVLEF